MAAPASDTIDQRFAQLIKQFGLTKNSFAISLGKTASVVQHLIDGRNKPGYDLLCKVFEIYPNVSRDWLLLGKGQMLVGGEPSPRASAALPAPTPAPDPVPLLEPLEPIDLSDVALPASRRPAPGVAGARLQPAEIAATLALAAAATQPVRTTVAAPTHAPEPHPVPSPPAGAEAPEAVLPPAVAMPVPTLEAPEAAAILAPAQAAPAPAAPAPAVAPVAPAALPPPAAEAAAPETYITAALHAQHLQHQLALAEMRNQHLLEQQQMLREMLAMARQAMV